MKCPRNHTSLQEQRKKKTREKNSAISRERERERERESTVLSWKLLPEADYFQRRKSGIGKKDGRGWRLASESPEIEQRKAKLVTASDPRE